MDLYSNELKAANTQKLPMGGRTFTYKLRWHMFHLLYKYIFGKKQT
jgi:hypothetical protein